MTYNFLNCWNELYWYRTFQQCQRKVEKPAIQNILLRPDPSWYNICMMRDTSIILNIIIYRVLYKKIKIIRLMYHFHQNEPNREIINSNSGFLVPTVHGILHQWHSPPFADDMLYRWYPHLGWSFFPFPWGTTSHSTWLNRK